MCVRQASGDVSPKPEKENRMDEKKFRTIIDRYLMGIATPEEIRAVEAFFEDYRKEGRAWPEHIMGDADVAEKQILAGILRANTLPEGRTTTFWRTPFKIAASLLITLGVAFGAYVYTVDDRPEVASQTMNAGGQRAMLKLADGTQVPLDSAGVHGIPQQGAARVSNANGLLAYTIEKPSDVLLYNTITTPRGGQYQVVLADGSSVWLNAASSLRYPTAFPGNERVVELVGEAYFEVAKDRSRPFRVKVTSPAAGVPPAEVRVLGTHFNVMAYPEEHAVATTLVEGRVAVSRGDSRAVLAPGQQGRLTDSGIAVIPDYDVAQAIAWKEGTFVFNDTPLDEIMRAVSRWYDVEVTFEDDLGALEFGGVVSRRENASAVLDLLELTGEVDFEVKKNMIVVRSGKKAKR